MFDIREILSTKKQKRLENKKRKIKAFLAMAKINDEDRQKVVVDMKRRSEEDYTLAKCDAIEAKRRRHDHNLTSRDSADTGPVTVALLRQETNSNVAGFVPRVICKQRSFSADEFAALRAELRERQRIKTQKPFFCLTASGRAAQIDDGKTSSSPLFLQDIQHLLLFALVDLAPYTPRWCQLNRRSKVSHVVVLVVEGLSIKTYLSHKEWFPKTATLFDKGVEIYPPIQYNNCVAEELLCVPVSVSAKLNMEKRKIVDNNRNQSMVHSAFRTCFPFPPVGKGGNSTRSAKNNCDNFPRTRLLLTPIVMLMENFPLPVQGVLSERYKGFVFTKDVYEEVTDNSPMFALDCEMVKTEIYEHEVVRATIVDEQLNVILDELIKPHNRIVDYLTPFSGITPAMLRHVTTRLSDVQEKIRAILPADAILCGHSLDRDLIALKMFHPYVIDTSIIYNLTTTRFRKSKLKLLSDKFLHEIIQDNPSGHCSAEDSSATMKLVKLKLQKCLEFGDRVMGGYVPEPDDSCSSSNDIPPQLENKTGLVTSFFNHLKEQSRTVALVGSDEALAQCSLEEAGFGMAGNVTKFSASSNKDVAQILRQKAMDYHFSLGYMNLVKAHVDPDRQQNVFNKLDQRIWKLYRDISPNALLLVIFSGTVSEYDQGFHNGLCLIKLKI